eukprot:Em0059g22a
MQQSTDNPSVGDAAEPQAVTIITEVAPQAAESRLLQPANSDTPAATCMSRKREVLLFDASLFPSLTAQLVISDEKIFRGTSIHIAQRRAFGREYCRYTERRF